MDIEVRIRGLMMDPATNMPIVVLKDVASDTVMPIWVGIFEANAIAIEIEKVAAPRPMTHDLARNLIRHLNGSLERVVITELRDDTFFATLWLRQDNDGTRRALMAEAQARGIDPARLVFAPRVDTVEEHAARQACADLFLDTLPYNAHATACDALWAGVPVITCRGGAFAGRVGAGLLDAVGLPELITDDLKAYEDLALALAQDAERLQTHKEKLAANRARAPLFDTDRYRRHIEAAFTTMMDIARKGEAPRPFAVLPD